MSYSSLEEGMKYLLSVLDLSGVGTKLVLDLSLYWWVLILTFLFAFLLSLLWIGLFISLKAFLLYIPVHVDSAKVCTYSSDAF